MKIIIKAAESDRAWDLYVDRLNEFGEVVRVSSVAMLQKGAEVLLSSRLSEDELRLLPDLKAVFLPKSGMDDFPVDALRRKGVEVITSHAVGDVIAEHALTLGLCLLHRTVEFDCDLRRGVWFSDGKDYFWTGICGMKVGVVGFGGIGRPLREKLQALGARVKVLNSSGIYPDGVDYANSLAELLEWCGMLFLCLPKTPETVGMIGEHELQQLNGKYLVNVARGDIVEQHSLYRALKSRQLRGYASDVWYRAPDKSDRCKSSAAWELDFGSFRNVVVSPHCATHVKDAHERYISDAVCSASDWICKQRGLVF